MRGVSTARGAPGKPSLCGADRARGARLSQDLKTYKAVFQDVLAAESKRQRDEQRDNLAVSASVDPVAAAIMRTSATPRGSKPGLAESGAHPSLPEG